MSLKDKREDDRTDLESLEMNIRSSMHNIGSIMLEEIVNADGGGYKGRVISSERGEHFEFIGYRDKEVLTVLGQVKIHRAYYHDKVSKTGYCPKDRALDIEGTRFSPGVRRIMGRVGAYRPFGLGREDIACMAGIDINTKEIERTSRQLGQEAEEFYKKEVDAGLAVIPIEQASTMYICMDGTGVPMVKAELVNRHGKSEDGQAKSREAKLGCVFTQTKINEKGYPVRDERSTSYVGFIEAAEQFGSRIYGEAIRRGLERARRVCVIGDGAPWIWNIADEQFYGAIQIVDLYHAREHYWNVAKAHFGNDKDKMSQWAERCRRKLDEGEVEEVILFIRQVLSSAEHGKEICEREINYFEKNKERMRYDEFRRQGLFVGSGVLEAGCKTVIGQRLKQSGMHWTVNGANSIIALRCCILSNRWEDFWEYRACA
jgi:hypothetical protein